MVLLLTIAVFLAMVIGILALYLMIMSMGKEESLSQRLKVISAPPEKSSPGWREYISKQVGAFTGRFKKQDNIQQEIVAMVTSDQLSGKKLMLSQAGFRHRMAYQIYFWIRIVLPVSLFLSAIFYGKGIGMPNQNIFLLSTLGLLFGFLLPIVYVRWKVSKRKEDITDALPDAIDLMVVCVEAGLALSASFMKIAEEFRISSPILSEEFDIVNREMLAGKPRAEALRALSDRTGVEEVKSLVAMLIQTEKLGTSLAQSLRVHSDSLRTKRRQRAEEAAAKTTIKLVFPLVFLLFPALFVVILGPGMIQIAKVLFPAMMGKQ